MRVVAKWVMIIIFFILAAVTPAMILFSVIQFSEYRIPDYVIVQTLKMINIDFSEYTVNVHSICLQAVYNIGILIAGIPLYFLLKKNEIFS